MFVDCNYGSEMKTHQLVSGVAIDVITTNATFTKGEQIFFFQFSCVVGCARRDRVPTRVGLEFAQEKYR